jgi:spore germination cell wall hydrolase CwlJ-like protein
MPTSSADSVIPYTNSELDLLARLIEAEAAGEIYEAKVAVGGVVVNRVQSPEWPNNITNVINHISGGYYQFTPVKNGMISKPASSDSIKAAKAAIYGSDPSKGALFYFDDSSTNQWLWSKTRTAYIDHMVFVK